MVIETSSGEQGGARRETTALSREVLHRIAAGALYPSLGVLLRPERAALAMSASTVTATLNASDARAACASPKKRLAYEKEHHHQASQKRWQSVNLN